MSEVAISDHSKPNPIDYLNLVHHIAGKMGKALTWETDMDDIVSWGTMGLLDAIRKFNPSRGEFKSYAFPKIRGAIIDGLRTSGCLSAKKPSKKKRHEKREAKIALLAHHLENIPSPSFLETYHLLEIADHLLRVMDASLTQREKEILRLVYFEELNFVEMEPLLGISRSRICQIHSAAILKLKKKLIHRIEI